MPVQHARSSNGLLAHAKWWVPEIPGPVSGGCGERERFGLEQRLTETSFEILASEAPGEQLAKGGVASAEGVNGFGEFFEAGVVIRLEHLALDNREVNSELRTLTSMSRFRV